MPIRLDSPHVAPTLLPKRSCLGAQSSGPQRQTRRACGALADRSSEGTFYVHRERRRDTGLNSFAQPSGVTGSCPWTPRQESPLAWELSGKKISDFGRNRIQKKCRKISRVATRSPEA